MKYRLAIVGIILIASNAATSEEYLYMGQGVKTCAEFGKAYQANPVLTAAVYFAWAQGYMGGVNTLLRRMNQPTRNLAGITTSAQQSYIRDYCDGHPLEEYVVAVADLFARLPVVSKDRPPPR